MIARDVDDAIESTRAFLGKDAADRTPAELAAIGPAVERKRKSPLTSRPRSRSVAAGKPDGKDREATQPRPDWMADPTLLPKRPPGR